MPLLVMLGAYAKILLVVRKRAASIRDAGRKPSIQADPSSGGGGGGGGGGGDQKRLVAGAAATQPKDDKQEQKLKREMKAVYTLLNIVVIFLLCWVPFYILFVLSAWFPTLFPPWYVTFSYWMAYINSAVNPILYPLSSPEFRQAYKKVILAMIGRA
ncbi:alpha-1A adrenergic receptor-like [Scylla paramamosain]